MRSDCPLNKSCCSSSPFSHRAFLPVLPQNSNIGHKENSRVEIRERFSFKQIRRTFFVLSSKASTVLPRVLFCISNLKQILSSPSSGLSSHEKCLIKLISIINLGQHSSTQYSNWPWRVHSFLITLSPISCIALCLASLCRGSHDHRNNPTDPEFQHFNPRWMIDIKNTTDELPQKARSDIMFILLVDKSKKFFHMSHFYMYASLWQSSRKDGKSAKALIRSGNHFWVLNAYCLGFTRTLGFQSNYNCVASLQPPWHEVRFLTFIRLFHYMYFISHRDILLSKIWTWIAQYKLKNYF